MLVSDLRRLHDRTRPQRVGTAVHDGDHRPPFEVHTVESDAKYGSRGLRGAIQALLVVLPRGPETDHLWSWFGLVGTSPIDFSLNHVVRDCAMDGSSDTSLEVGIEVSLGFSFVSEDCVTVTFRRPKPPLY